MNLSLAYSPCPNDTFMFDALVNGRIPSTGYDWNVHIADVQALNESTKQAAFDVTKLSYAQYAQVAEEYQLLTTGSALGHGCGPLLIAKDRISFEDVPDHVIAVPGKDTTAHFLFNNFFPTARNKQFMVFSEVEPSVLNGDSTAGVIIHENRFTYQALGLQKVADLGELWENTYGFAIPLGGIAIRRSLPDEVKSQVNELIRLSVSYAFQHPEASRDYVRQYATEMDENVMAAHIELYVNAYSLELGQSGKSAVAFLLNRMCELGLAAPSEQQIFIY